MAQEPKRLRRSSRDKMLFGVAGGVAEYFSVDPTIIRILFVVSVVFGGAGILLYLAMAIAMPADGPATPGSGGQGGSTSSGPGEVPPGTVPFTNGTQRALVVLLFAIGAGVVFSGMMLALISGWFTVLPPFVTFGLYKGLVVAVAIVAIGLLLLRRRATT